MGDYNRHHLRMRELYKEERAIKAKENAKKLADKKTDGEKNAN